MQNVILAFFISYLQINTVSLTICTSVLSVQVAFLSCRVRKAVMESSHGSTAVWLPACFPCCTSAFLFFVLCGFSFPTSNIAKQFLAVSCIQWHFSSDSFPNVHHSSLPPPFLFIFFFNCSLLSSQVTFGSWTHSLTSSLRSDSLALYSAKSFVIK